jgi:hypothetical protein
VLTVFVDHGYGDVLLDRPDAVCRGSRKLARSYSVATGTRSLEEPDDA